MTPPPTAIFATQPSPMSDTDAAAFERDPLFEAALELRKADDAASDVTVRADAETLKRQMRRVRRLADDLDVAGSVAADTAGG